MNDGFWFTDIVRDKEVVVFEFLQRKYPFVDWEERFKKGSILVNDDVLKDRKGLGKRGDEIKTFKDPWIEPTVDKTIEILQETDELVVFNKRSGYPVVPHAEYQESAFVTIVQKKFKEGIPLHRLGTGTTGAIVFAKSKEAAKKYCKLFEHRKVRKVYRCVVSGVPEWEELERNVCFIGTVKHKNLDLAAAVTKEEGGKESITSFKVVKKGENFAVVDCHIETGRPHQIRIHTAFVGFPLLNDPLYTLGGKPYGDKVPGHCGYLLHSMRLRLEGTDIDVICKPPNMEEWSPYCNDFI